MFRAAIRETPFCTDIANEYFTNVYGASYNGDNTFLSTMRAIFPQRMPDGDSIELRFTSSSYRMGQLDSASKRDILQAVTSEIYSDSVGVFHVHSLNCGSDANDRIFDVIKESFTSKYEGYQLLDIVSGYFKKSFRVIGFINLETKCAVVFVESLNIPKLHYLQHVIIPCMPWYLNTGDDSGKLTEDEIALFSSLREKEPDKYMACLAKLAEKYDFRKMRLSKMLKGFELRFERAEVQRVESQIASKDAELDRLNDAFGTALSQRNNLCTKLLGLQQKIAAGDEDSEIMDYFMCNNSLYLERVSESMMEFSAFGYCEYFNEEMVENSLRNNRSYIYSLASGSISAERMVKLMKAIFIDRTLRLRFCAGYYFDLNGSAGGRSDHAFPQEMQNMMPNPHIQNHSCLGNHRTEINNLLRNRNYIGAIEQCVSSVMSLDWGDPTVIHEFINDMYRNRMQCIELPDGTVVKPLAAIEWLESQEATEDGQTQEQEEEA